MVNELEQALADLMEMTRAAVSLDGQYLELQYWPADGLWQVNLYFEPESEHDALYEKRSGVNWLQWKRGDDAIAVIRARIEALQAENAQLREEKRILQEGRGGE